MIQNPHPTDLALGGKISPAKVQQTLPKPPPKSREKTAKATFQLNGLA